MAKASRRQRRLWLSVAATVFGLAGLLAAGIWRDRRSDTDLQDPTAAVTTVFHHDVPKEGPALVFRDVARELGIEMRHGPGDRGRTLPEDTGSGLAWGDYDGDGDFDLYVVNFAGPLGGASSPAGSNRLFRNDPSAGERGFVDVTERAGVADLDGFGMGAAFADYDADGDLDLYVTNYGPNRLFRNRGDGSFEEVAEKLGVDSDEWSIAAIWADFDRDGWLDLYVTNYVRYDPGVAEIEVTDPNWQEVPFSLNPNAFDPAPNRFYRGLPGGSYREEALALGVANGGGRSLGATAVDFDLDGWLDLYVANDVSPNALFRNLAGELEGEILFEDWSARTGTADVRGSMGISVADIAAPGQGVDGVPDLFISHWVAQENALYVGARGKGGRLEYRDRIRQFRLGEVSTDRVGWGTAFADFDLDARLDLVVANGSTLEEGPFALEAQPPFLFWNAGDRFYDLTAVSGEDLAQSRVARGLAVCDFDLDGDVDLAVSINRGTPLLLRSEGERRGGWLVVRLGNPVAHKRGTQVALERRTSADTRFWGADASFASDHAPEQLFGLGQETEAKLNIRWPDGRRLSLPNLQTNRRLVIVGR